jgi:hypothetical protein
MNLQEMLDKTQNDGYPVQDARAKVCQDIVLKAIAESSLSRNVTIHGSEWRIHREQDRFRCT